MPILVNLPDGSQASFPDGTAPDVMKAAIQKKFPPQQAASPVAAAQPQGRDPGLFVPGAPDVPGTPPVNTVPPSQHFGFSSSDTLNPLPALSTFGNELAGAVPIAGPTLRNMGENFDAAVDNMVYRPLQGLKGVTSPEDVAASNAASAEANPEATTAGRIAGIGLPLLGAGSTVAGAKLLGLSGPLWQRMLMGGASTFGIQAADEVSRGKPLSQALGDALLPGAAGATLPLGGAMVKKILAPIAEAGPQRAAAVATMKQEGVPLTAGQASGSKWLRYRESELGGNKAQDFVENQGQQFTKAALAKAGVKADAATPDVLNKAYDDIGKELDGLASRNVIIPDKQFGSDLKSALTEYQNVKASSQQAPIVGDIITDIANKITKGGAIDGEWYKATRTKLGATASKTTDPELKGALLDINHALDDAMERSIAKTNPKDLGAWKDVRGRYRNLIVLTAASDGAGEAAAMGVISPAKLRQAIVATGKNGYVRGRSDLEPLARGGNATMAPLPDSGTASRVAARLAPMGLSAISGGLAGSNVGGMTGAAVGSLAGAALSTGLGHALLSGPGRAYLSGRAAPKFTESQLANLLPRALILSGGAGQ